MTTDTDHQPLLEESIEIDAPPVAVWALVTDLPRMAEWSPQVVKTFVRGGQVRHGATMVNINRRGPLFWPTQSKVVRFEPHRDFAFRIKENWTIWSFELEPTATGTRLTQRREAPQGISNLSKTLTRRVLGGQDSFQSELREGMRGTLERIKREAETR